MVNKLLTKLEKEIKELEILERDYLKLGNKIADHKMRLALKRAELEKTSETDRTANNPRTSTGQQNAQDYAGQEIKEIKCNCMDRKESRYPGIDNHINKP